MVAMRWRRPPQRGQRRTSSAKVRSRSSAQERRWGEGSQPVEESPSCRGVAVGTMRSRSVEAGASEPWVVAGPAVLPRMGHESREALQEGEWLEHERPRPVAPGLAQGPLDLAVPADLEAALGEGRAGDVADESFEALGVGAVDAGGGVEGEAVAFGDQAVGVGEAL